MTKRLTSDGMNAVPPLGLTQRVADPRLVPDIPSEPVIAAEPGPVPEQPDVPAAPPRAGSGATRDAWATYAGLLGVPYEEADTRGDIIARVDAATAITVQDEAVS